MEQIDQLLLTVVDTIKYITCQIDGYFVSQYITNLLITIFTGLYAWVTYKDYQARKPVLGSYQFTYYGYYRLKVKIINNATHNIVIKCIYARKTLKIRKLYKLNILNSFYKYMESSYWIIPLKKVLVISEQSSKDDREKLNTYGTGSVLIKEDGIIEIALPKKLYSSLFNLYVVTSAGKCKIRIHKMSKSYLDELKFEFETKVSKMPEKV